MNDPAKMKEFFEPNLYLYDAYPGGIGFSEPLYRVHDLLLRRTRELIAAARARGLPFVRRPRGREKRAHQGSGARDSGAHLRMRRDSDTTRAIVAALKPARRALTALARRRGAAWHLARYSRRRRTARGDSWRVGRDAIDFGEHLGSAAMVFGAHWRRAEAGRSRRRCDPRRCGCSRPARPKSRRSAAVAFPRYGNHRPRGRHGHVSVPGRHCLVGRGRARSRAVFHARAQRRTFACSSALAERMAERPRARHIQRQIVRLAAARNALPHDAHDSPAGLRAHLDFLHPARNLWRLRLGSVRLAELERHVLGWNRGADMMSELIPQIYFDYLARRPARAARSDLSSQPDGPARACRACDARPFAARKSGNARAGRRSNFSASRESANAAAKIPARANSTNARSRPSCRRKRIAPHDARSRSSQSAKEISLWRCELWEGMLGNSREGFEAYEQLAIYYEHRAREPHRAASLARKGAYPNFATRTASARSRSAAYRQRRARFEQRLARLERKAGRTLLDALEAESRIGPGESNR